MNKIFKVLSILGHVLGTAAVIYLFDLANSTHAACVLGFLTFTILVEGSQFDTYLEDVMVNDEWPLMTAIKEYYWYQTGWSVTQNLLGVLFYVVVK